ncbi:TPA: hypothetical protein QDZ34_003653 [Stenotrophomonas maltophilia]|nr:hypothetical protein [Stenotrophomonas maltophilia]HDS1027426.1 hypothetical protein [Stenotrophomonas maltophilia]HDS1031515.1 hypothetical protein [Stenotrophomonas maltophilia]HDS1036260.1 hypothetical protein [Stenotrophomonas maltophilia]
MDASPMAPAVALRWSDSPLPQRATAWLLVLLLHAVLGWWLWQAGRLAPVGSEAARISLRWLPAAPAPEPQAIAAPALPPAAQIQAQPTGRPAVAAPPLSVTEAENDKQTTQAPLVLGLPAGSIEGGDGITAAGIAPKLIGRRDVHPAFAPRRNYFRIRRQMTPEQIVHGVAQLLGLWPPGYIVDPCELGKQDMGYFQGAVEEMDREALRQAVQVVSARCR